MRVIRAIQRNSHVREARAAGQLKLVHFGDPEVQRIGIGVRYADYTTRRSYLMSELRDNYSAVDYSTLKKDSEQFHHIGEVVRNFEARKKRKPAGQGQ
jgi:hypothetical protein